jgi:signal transduction histidine kinase
VLPRAGEVTAPPDLDRARAGSAVEDAGAAGAAAAGSWLSRHCAERTAALGKLLRTTAFKLTLVYLIVFALFAAFVLAYFAWNTRRLINEQITETVDAEIQGLSDQYRQGGIRRLAFAIEARSLRPGSSLYLLTTAAGELVAGNVGALATGILDKPGWSQTVYRRIDEQDASEHHALVRVDQLPGGFHLLVGRDLEERERLYDVVLAAGNWSVAIVVVLGLAGGFFVARRVLKRIDAMTETARTIMQGDLHERLPVAGTGDELDRLAVNLNAMLERIEALMRGFKEVSDNIAHDLKTPLTRLHNRCEEALRAAGNEAQYREALGSTIEESEALIRTFNALLMIARAESGHVRDDMKVFDVAEIVRGIGDLYEPLADDKGLALRVEAAAPAWVRGNRELISQALANLVDNAIKYGASGGTANSAAAGDAANGDAANGAAANGHPEVVLAAKDRGDRIVLSVADSGPGIAPADRARVLERFVRLEQSRSEPGSGLGLSLAAAIARLHDGELILEDNHPGLISMMSLPRAAAPLPAPAG